MTRCKFKCESKTMFADTASIVLRPVTTGSEENKNFYKYTPGGELMLSVVNTEAADQFRPGKEYYIDISEAN